MRNKYVANHLLNRDGDYYFVRRVPNDLKNLYAVKRLCFSLKTKSYSSAIRMIKSVSQRLEDYWFGIRLQNMNVPAMHLIKTDSDNDNGPNIIDALQLYLKLKGVNKNKTFLRTAHRNVEYIIKVLGNKSIQSYSSLEAGKFRDWLIEQGMSNSTVKRVFSSVRAIINLSIIEYGLNIVNPFSKVYLPSIDNELRMSIPMDKIRLIHGYCRQMDDEPRWLISLLSDSGMRLSEALGLAKEDIKLDEPIPYIRLIPHPWRRLKTRSSQRYIPLVGEALWACKRILEHNDDSIFAFPRYTSINQCNANSASAALNKWLKSKLIDDYVIHGFRHSFRDRLRTVECPSEIIDQLGGWSLKSVGQGYGKGFSKDILFKWMKQI